MASHLIAMAPYRYRPRVNLTNHHSTSNIAPVQQKKSKSDAEKATRRRWRRERGDDGGWNRRPKRNTQYVRYLLRKKTHQAEVLSVRREKSTREQDGVGSDALEAATFAKGVVGMDGWCSCGCHGSSDGLVEGA